VPVDKSERMKLRGDEQLQALKDCKYEGTCVSKTNRMLINAQTICLYHVFGLIGKGVLRFSLYLLIPPSRYGYS
jgi:hypothetical protein